MVKKLTGGLGQLSKQRKVQYIQGRAAFENSTTLASHEGRRRRTRIDALSIASFSPPVRVRPSFPRSKLDSPRMMDSTGALDLEDIPKTLLVVGGGYIGLELGSVYAALGTRVTVVEMLPGLLPGADRDLVLPLHKRLEKLFDGILLNTTVTSVKGRRQRNPSHVQGADVKERKRKSSTVCWFPSDASRTPKSPASTRLRCKVGPRGFIQVNKQLQTDDPSIYAIGDVVGEPMLAHKASHEGRTAVEAIAGHKVAFEPQRDSRSRLHRSRNRLGRTN